MTDINLGLIKFMWRGNYNLHHQYHKDDVVGYDGSSYIAIDDTHGDVPNVSHSHWEIMVAGISGTTSTLPPVTPADSGKTLLVDAAGDWIVSLATSGVTLPTITASDAGKSLQVSPAGTLELTPSVAKFLPPSHAFDAGKILTINSGGQWSAADPAAVSSGLPPATNTDVGKTIQVSPIGKFELSPDVPLHLPPITATDDGKALVVKNGAWDKSTSVPDHLPPATNTDVGKTIQVSPLGKFELSPEVPSHLPPITVADDDKVLVVKNGAWDKSASVPNHLPDAIDTDVGKTIQVSPLGEYELSPDVPLHLPPTTAADDDKVLVVKNGAWDKSDDIPNHLPDAIDTDENKISHVDDQGDWVISSYEIPVPDPLTDGLFLKSDGGSYTLDKVNDDISRTWMTSGVISGFHPVTILASGVSISIPAGKVIYMENIEGEPKRQIIRDVPADTRYDLTGIATHDVTYIYLEQITGNILEEYTEPEYVRGEKILLYRIDHSDNSRIESVHYLFNNQNALAEQIKELWASVGNKVIGLTLHTGGVASFGHNGGEFYGFNVGSGTSLLKPHKKTLPLTPLLKFEFRDASSSDGSTLTTFPSVPKIELTVGTKTDLQDDHTAFYPVWILPSNRLIIQIATKEYSDTDVIPSLNIIASEIERDSDANKIGVLVGFVKWTKGKDFSNDNKFLAYTLNDSHLEHGLPKLTPTDEDRVLQGDVSGHAKWGAKIIAPNGISVGGTKNAVFNEDGDLVAGSGGGASIPSAPSGDYLVAVRNGQLEALTNRTDYVQPSFWSTYNLDQINTHPFPKDASNIGIQCTNMTKNNAGALSAQKLRLADVWTATEDMGSGLPKSVLSVTALNRSQADLNTRMKAFKTSSDFSDWMRPSSRNKIRQNFIVVSNPLKNYWQSDISTTSTDTSAILTHRVVDYYTYLSAPELHHNTPGVDNISFSKVGRVAITNDANGKNIVDLNLSSLGVPTDPNVTVTITFTEAVFSSSFVIPGATSSTLPRTSTAKITLVTSGVDPIVGTQVYSSGNMVARRGLPSSNTIALNLSSSIKGVAAGSTIPNFNHGSGITPSKTIFYGCYCELGAVDAAMPLRNDETVYVNYGIKGHINVSRSTSGGSALARTDSRYEFDPLKNISNLPAHDPDTPFPANFTGAIKGTKPKIKAGKIIIAYCVLFPSRPSSFDTFKPDHKGLSPNAYTLTSMPSIFLENQTGSNKFTERIEAVKRHAMSQEMQIYELDCTQAQFDSWKLVVYFHTTVAESRFKEITKKIGASLWFVNAEDIED